LSEEPIEPTILQSNNGKLWGHLLLEVKQVPIDSPATNANDVRGGFRGINPPYKTWLGVIPTAA